MWETQMEKHVILSNVLLIMSILMKMELVKRAQIIK